MLQDYINDKTFEELVEKFVNNTLKYTSKGGLKCHINQQ